MLPPDPGVSLFRVFFLRTVDTSRVSTEETAHARPRGNLERAAPRRGSSYCWPRASSGVGDAPHRRKPTAGAPRLAAPASCGPRWLRSANTRPRRKAGFAGRLRAHRRACLARTDALAPRVPTRTLRALRRAYLARLPARRPARLPARSWRVLRHAADAFTDAHPARLEARSRHISAACEVFAF